MNVGDLKKYKDNCYTALSRDITEFEKNFLFVSGGILAFSTTFIKDIVKASEASFLWLLFLSWLFIIVSIGLMMLSFLKSANSSDKLWSIVDRFLLTNNLYDESHNLTSQQASSIKQQVDKVFHKSKSCLKRIRNWAVITFLAGILSFSTFVSINLSKEKKLVNEENQQSVLKK